MSKKKICLVCPSCKVCEIDLKVASTLDEADMIFALKSYAQPEAKIFKISESKKLPIKIYYLISLIFGFMFQNNRDIFGSKVTQV